MADLTTRERLQPSLLDRLIDDDPENRRESRDSRVLSGQQLRQGVLRDLAWLLNTTAHREIEGLGDFPEVLKSVLNFGVPDMTGISASSVNPAQLERALEDAIRLFEPRILPHTLTVRVVTNAEAMNHTALTFEISGDLWALPVPDPLYVRTELDLETGQCVLGDRPNG